MELPPSARVPASVRVRSFPVVILNRRERASLGVVILGRSRPKAVAQTRGSMPRRSGMRGEAAVLRRIADAQREAWIPDTSSCASLGRRSGMTKGRGRPGAALAGLGAFFSGKGRAGAAPDRTGEPSVRPSASPARSAGARAALRVVILGRSRPKAVAETRGSMPRRGAAVATLAARGSSCAGSRVRRARHGSRIRRTDTSGLFD